MKKLTEFQRDDIKMLRVEINNALKDVAVKYGIELKLGNINFTSANFSAKLKASTINGNGTVMCTEAVNVDKYGKMYGLNGKLNDEFTDYTGQRFRIAGFKPRSQKYPVIAKDIRTGELYKFSINLVNSNLA